MGLLTVGTPLSWEDVTKEMCDKVRRDAAAQYLYQYRRHKEMEETRGPRQLKWGEEIEYTVLHADPAARVTRLSLRAPEILAGLNKVYPAASLQSTLVAWHPEYANWMIEGTPGQPYGNMIIDLLAVEANMGLRRRCPLEFLEADEFVLSIPAFPRMGCPDGICGAARCALPGPASQSLFLPDEAINPHPRFPTLTANIRKRRGEKVEIRVPLMMDERTDPALCRSPHAPADAAPHIYLDSMAFGMGSSCLQMTFQAGTLSEARHLYDQLAVMGPFLLALTAATPSYRGFLADTDVRWNQISLSVDDRTRYERGLPAAECAAVPGAARNGERRLNKSRYSTVNLFLSDGPTMNPKYNDVEVQHDEAALRFLLDNGLDAALAAHVAHQLVRDPLVLYRETMDQDDATSTDHYENLGSTNWNSMRLKLPPSNADIGWRVEFRTMEVQLTDFENAAFSIFTVLLSRIVLAFKLNFYIPISQVDENMERAHRRDAVQTQRFYFRRHVTDHDACVSVLFEGLCCCTDDRDSTDVVDEYTLHEIMNGKERAFPGLIPMVHNYLDLLECAGEARIMLNQYLTLISHRASGKLQTPAQFMRAFLVAHSTYEKDSVVSPEAAHDLMDLCKRLTEGKAKEPALYGNLWPRSDRSPDRRRTLHLPGDVCVVTPATGPFVPVRAKGALVSNPVAPKSPGKPNGAPPRWEEPEVALDYDVNAAPPEPHTGAPYAIMRYQMSAHLKALLKDIRDFHPQYAVHAGPTICNHTYMALIALFHLGASRSWLQYWYDHSLLDPVRRQEHPLCITADTWQDHRGGRDFAEMRDFFEKEASRLGRTALLERYLPDLLPALCRGCLHPLIRLAYALHEEGEDGVADALAYWTVKFSPMFPGAGDPATHAIMRDSHEYGPAETLRTAKATRDQAQADPTLPHCPYSDHDGLMTCPKVQDLAFRVACPPGKPDEVLGEMLSLAVRLFLAAPSFMSLHAVTGGHALWTLLPYIKDAAVAAKLYWTWVVALYILKQCPELAPLPEAPATAPADDGGERGLRWDEVRRAALQSSHVHIIKMAWACWHLHQRLPGDELFLIAVEQQLQRGTPF